jgi:hypothetical protein
MVKRWEEDPDEDERLPATRHRRERAALGALTALYRDADATFAPWSCPASGECCQLGTTGLQPWLWPVEWLKVERALAAAGRSLPPPRKDGGCPLLDAPGRRCTIYADRPLGCRTYFCGRIRGPADQPYEKMDALQRRLEQVSRELDGPDAEPKPLLGWAQREG